MPNGRKTDSWRQLKQKLPGRKKPDKQKQPRHQQNAAILETFAKRAKDATIDADATTEEAKAAGHAATAKAETTFAVTIAMQGYE